MGVELELPELAALRPIRTAVSGGGADGATPRESVAMVQTRRDGGEEVGGVTPVMASGSTARRRDGGEEGVAAESGCATPTSGASALPPATVCPPAPRKPRLATKRKHRCGRRPPPRRPFFPVPHDLAAVFVPRAAAAASPAPPCQPAAKKIRVHAVG